MYATPDQIKLLKHYPEVCPSLRIVFVQTNTLAAFLFCLICFLAILCAVFIDKYLTTSKSRDLY